MHTYPTTKMDRARVAATRYAPHTTRQSPAVKFITEDAEVIRLLAQADRIAGSAATVLITGESGTGKEVLAQRLHDHSSRCGAPLVRLNCAALAEGVLESELFGHEKGAFTGAVRQRPGRFEQANGGTLFLDEIGAADLRVQLRLLRVLQEREFERVGGTETLRVDVRVIAATNVDLRQEVAKGTFREDLFYRLNVVPLALPPLRRRKGDIRLLVEHFMRRVASRSGCAVHEIDAGALDLLRAYPWPGNVRQLENAVERMVLLAGGAVLRRADVPEEILYAEEDESEEEGQGFKEARNAFERRFLCAALHRHRGVISQVAEAVGLSRKSLYAKLEHLDIDYQCYRFRS
ncbi:MAG: hypothetical protein CME20_23240 [Gemmatimonadetes bacterium]|nr:hypothetical protein [Gemmatimonadota bacterium]